MKTATFDHSVKVLLKAYLNDTLMHGNCFACAVGNLICDANAMRYVPTQFRKIAWAGYENTYTSMQETPMWSDVFCSELSSEGVYQNMRIHRYEGERRRQIDSTGYPVEHLAKIEFAFESSDRGKSDDDYMFNGLMAVIDVLAEIHNVDLTTVKETKELFV